MTTYNCRSFKEDIGKAEKLSYAEVKSNEEILKTELKKANEIPFIKELNLQYYLDELNILLTKSIKEQIIISEFIDNNAKRQFAEKGLLIHEAHDKCAFCGNEIKEERLNLLKSYFSVNEVKEFQYQINTYITKIKEIKEIKEKVNNLYIDKDQFYPHFIHDIDKLKGTFSNNKKDIEDFLQSLLKHAENKLKELFTPSLEWKIHVPEDINIVVGQYNDYVKENNSSNLAKEQELAKNKLRLHHVKLALESDEYKQLKENYSKVREQCKLLKVALQEKQKELSDINFEIAKKEKELITLLSQTKSEKILADKINQELRLYVNFTLEYVEDTNEGNGFYQVKDKLTGNLRDIIHLSTGEKNIIAFLYFILKLGEIKEEKTSFPKIIIFDDPMNSNDDGFQYLIIEKLNNLLPAKTSKAMIQYEKALIMTHNKHFYINLRFGYSYQYAQFMHFLSSGDKVHFENICEEKNDFKTSYESLWNELEFLYECESIEATMLLNPIRRIIDTFAKFNAINKEDMFNNVPGAKKLFNVNSHSVDDLEAELNGKSKDEIINIMRGCFNGYKTHFEKHWKFLN